LKCFCVGEESPPTVKKIVIKPYCELSISIVCYFIKRLRFSLVLSSTIRVVFDFTRSHSNLRTSFDKDADIT